jgi:nickel transport protein
MRRLAAFLAMLFLAAPAQAHKLKVFASVEGSDIVGSAYFVGGDKAAGVPGRILGADGSQIAIFATGPDGGFRQGVTARMDHTVMVESEDGHAAQFTIPAAQFPSALPEGRVMAPATEAAAAAALEAAIARQIRPLREQLDAYESRIRLHDVMGGIGTIFGLFGCWAWLQSRRRGS